MITLSDEVIHDAELVEEDAAIEIDKPSGIFGPLTQVQALAMFLVLILLSSTLLYVLMGKEESELPEVQEEILVDDPAVFVTDSTGASIDVEPIDMTFFASSVGEDAAEPSIGITSTGCVFFIAFEKVMRSCDYGDTWEAKQDPVMCSPTTSDPYGWVDPITDRVFGVQMIGLETSWICWSDDDGETWLGNPHDSGTTPLNDHIKLATGPWTSAGYGAIGQITGSAIYETAVYYCYNKIAGIFCFTSFDGGATFDTGGLIVGLATTNGGLHGAISTAPDGTVYVTPRVATPTVIVSKDNGFHGLKERWERMPVRLIQERILRFQPTQIPMHITYGLVLMKVFISQGAQILERVGNKKVSELALRELSQQLSHKPMQATLEGLLSHTWEVKMLL